MRPASPSSFSRAILKPDTSHHQKVSPRITDRTMPSLASPLSPRAQPLDVPSQARRRPNLNSRQSSHVAPSAHLRLPNLPRFHPANFASQNSSQASTPITGPNSPQAPLSPRVSSNRQYEIQRQMYNYQQQLLSASTRQMRGPGAKPTGPRLAPLASPGVVTPLELEDEESGYLTAGVHPAETTNHIEHLIRIESRRLGECASR